MNQLSTETRVRVISCLVEGNSQRATTRMTGVAKKTVARLGLWRSWSRCSTCRLLLLRKCGHNRERHLITVAPDLALFHPAKISPLFGNANRKSK